MDSCLDPAEQQGDEVGDTLAPGENLRFLLFCKGWGEAVVQWDRGLLSTYVCVCVLSLAISEIKDPSQVSVWVRELNHGFHMLLSTALIPLYELWVPLSTGPGGSLQASGYRAKWQEGVVQNRKHPCKAKAGALSLPSLQDGRQEARRMQRKIIEPKCLF